MRGIDFAQHTIVPTPEDWREIDAAGYGDFVIIGLGDLNKARRGFQVESALRAGKTPEGYVYLSGAAGEGQMTEACEFIQREGYDIPFLWPDAEQRGALSQLEMVGILDRCVRIGASAGWDRATRQGIYTGRWWWVPNTHNAQHFADMALWTAYYNTDAQGNWQDDWPIDFSWFQSYGGWTNLPRLERRDTRQYRGTYDLHGVNVDLNWRDDSWAGGNDEMDDAARRDLDFEKTLERSLAEVRLGLSATSTEPANRVLARKAIAKLADLHNLASPPEPKLIVTTQEV